MPSLRLLTNPAWQVANKRLSPKLVRLKTCENLSASAVP